MTHAVTLQKLLAGLASAYDPERQPPRRGSDDTLLALFSSLPAADWVEAA